VTSRPAGAAPSPQRGNRLPRDNGLKTFTLQADYTAPKGIANLGSAGWLGSGRQTVGGPLGWWDNNVPQTDAILFVQYNAKKGIIFDSTQTARTLYLKEPNSQGLRELVLGAPALESHPDKVLEKDWSLGATMVTPGQPHYWLGYQGKYVDAWSACDTPQGWKLYFGAVKNGRPASGCTTNFELEVKYQGGNPPCC